MDYVLEIIKLFTGGSILISVAGIAVAMLKRGQFEGWGYKVGRALSKFASAKIGKSTWEKIEDVITVSFVSFAKGIKEGADSDDIKQG